MATENKKKSAVSQAISEVDELMNKISEGASNTLRTMLDERVEKFIKEAIEDDAEPEYEVSDEEPTNDEGSDESEETVEPAADEQPEEDAAEAEADSEESTEDAEEVPAEEDGDEWSEFDKYKVGEDTWDLTGEKDSQMVAKVYKLLNNGDQVVIKTDGDKIELKDNETGSEYVIDLGDDSPAEEDLAEDAEDDEVDAMYADEQEKHALRNDDDLEGGNCMKEGKNSKKVMKENKETLFEIDLGYTDNYQDKDPIEGLSMSEPSKSGKDWDKGLPKGTEKPWAGKSDDKGEPYGAKSVDEEVAEDETPVEEGATSLTTQASRKETKQKTANGRADYLPQKSKNISTADKGYQEELNEIKAQLDKILKENKILKKAILKAHQNLEESYVVNANLGQITKLLSENTVTQSEKVDIVNRFDKCKTVEESNALYESIKRELAAPAKAMPALNESTVAVDGSRETIVESTNYKSSEELHIIDLMKRMNMM